MTIQKLYAQIACADLPASTPWFETLFGRPPDATPMEHLAEWHLGDAGLQLFQDPANAGHTTLTVIVSGLRDEHARLSKAGLKPGEVEPANYVSLIRLKDPDGNAIILAEPGKV